jgi:hypothetical protein
MTVYDGCWVECVGRKNWAITWPDTTPMEIGFTTRREAVDALLYYIESDKEQNGTRTEMSENLSEKS